MSMTSPAKFHHVTQIMLQTWSYDQSLAFVVLGFSNFVNFDRFRENQYLINFASAVHL